MKHWISNLTLTSGLSEEKKALLYITIDSKYFNSFELCQR